MGVPAVSVYSWPMPDVPLAYLITFRCYGTWLHGDERGSIDRHRSQYNSEYIIANPNWHDYNVRHLKHAPARLTDAQRQSVEAAVRETCQFRNWELKAVNVRSNHVHSLVSTGSLRPERVLNALKANATRQLRQDGCWPHPRPIPELDPPPRDRLPGTLAGAQNPDTPIRYRGRY